jgi:hypothetical protein
MEDALVVTAGRSARDAEILQGIRFAIGVAEVAEDARGLVEIPDGHAGSLERPIGVADEVERQSLASPVSHRVREREHPFRCAQTPRGVALVE